MKRTLTALAAVAAAALVPSAAPSTAHAASCGGINAIVLSIGAQVTQLQEHGASCATARSSARRWLSGLSKRDAFVYCAPPSGAPSETCKIGRYSCRATAVRGATADTMRCHYGRRTMSWRGDFNMQFGPDWEQL